MSIAISLAEDSDLSEIAALVNSAYRGESSKEGWATETDLVGGQRTDPESLRRDLAERRGRILCLRQEPAGPIVACVLLERKAPDKCYLGMLTVRPKLQAAGIGRRLLESAETYARNWGAKSVVMTVIHLRDTLIAWYERRGYVRTGETQPFPYGDEKFGVPKVDGLYFVVLEKQL